MLLARLVAWAQARQGRVASFTLRMLHERARDVPEPFTDLPGVFTEVPESTLLVVDEDGMHHEAFAPVG